MKIVLIDARGNVAISKRRRLARLGWFLVLSYLGEWVKRKAARDAADAMPEERPEAARERRARQRIRRQRREGA